MGNRHVSVMIGAPPETVFGLYTDPGRTRDWQAGVRDLRVTGPPDQPGSRAVIVYRWPFKMTAEVLQVEPPARHVQRLKELLGLVTCTTTARLRRIEDGTDLRLDMDYRVAGGPIGRLFDARVGTEMVATAGRDLARLKALVEDQAGPRQTGTRGGGMPHPNVETLRRYDEAQVAGDLETVLSQYTDDVLGHVGGDNQLSGDYRGLEQLQAMLGRFMEASGEYSFENHAYLADDEHGIVLQRGTMRRGGDTFSTNEVFVVHFRDGKISEFWYQPWDQAGVDAWFGK
jgi:ketosteroid isomerase-like protein